MFFVRLDNYFAYKDVKENKSSRTNRLTVSNTQWERNEIIEVNSEIYFLNSRIQGDNNSVIWNFFFLLNSFLSESIHSWLMWCNARFGFSRIWRSSCMHKKFKSTSSEYTFCGKMHYCQLHVCYFGMLCLEFLIMYMLLLQTYRNNLNKVWSSQCRLFKS